MIKIAFKKEFKFMLMFFRSFFLFLRAFLASFHLTSLLEFRAFRSNDASEFWSFRKLTSSRVIDKLWWTTTMTKNLTWMTTIVRIVFDVVVSRVLLAVNVLNKKLFTFRYVLSSWMMFLYLIFTDLHSFSYRRLSIVWRSCRFTRRRDIIENILEKMSDFTILFDCMKS
jgi:hypothetical protein